MVRRAVVFVTLLCGTGLAQEREPSCVTNCHGEEATSFAAGVHATRLACIDCHGGDPTAHRAKFKSHDPDKGYVGKITRLKIPSLCAGCHSDPLRMAFFDLPTDQFALYKTSGHGKAVLLRGDVSAAVCTDCHGSHRVFPVKDPRAPTARANLPETCGRCHTDAERMKPYGIPTDTVDRFRRSVHGRALLDEHSRGAPSCADCHGAHGATPPGVRDIVQVCGHCHVNTAEHYRKSAHFASGEMQCAACHEEKLRYRGSGCTVCHDAHGTTEPGAWMFLGDEVHRCGHCHREPDGAAALTTTIREGTARLETAMDRTRDEIRIAKESGLFLDDEQVYLNESRRALVAMQPLSHSMNADAISAHLDAGTKRQDRARETIEKKFIVLRDRRLLLLAIAAVLLLLVALLAVKLGALRRLS